MPYKLNPFTGKLDSYETAKNTVVTVSANYDLPTVNAYFSTIMVTAAAEVDLPVASPGMIIRIYSTGDNVVKTYPASGGSIVLTGTNQGVDKGVKSPGASGDFIELFTQDSTTWVITNQSGTWILYDKYGTITVTSPNGGESWMRGSTHDITWDYTIFGAGDFVKIELIQDSTVISTISASTACDGTFSWEISEDLDYGDYKIRITAL